MPLRRGLFLVWFNDLDTAMTAPIVRVDVELSRDHPMFAVVVLHDVHDRPSQLAFDMADGVDDLAGQHRESLGRNRGKHRSCVDLSAPLPPSRGAAGPEGVGRYPWGRRSPDAGGGCDPLDVDVVDGPDGGCTYHAR